jgi:hypothetical protein
MQTFVPLTSSFEDIARTLDRARLNKQALEGWQILMTLLELDPQGNYRAPKGWVNHPAVKMWRGHEMALYLYIQAMVDEWKRRGYKSTIGDKAKETIKVALSKGLLASSVSTNPHWISDMKLFKEVAASHRLALLTKDYEWYSQFNWDEDTGKKPETYEYVWPK